jgi:regulator of protease activity HflC (stomatin/prohibitin superfamily)
MGITVRIRQHERGLRFRYGDFVGLALPGRYRLWSRLFGSKRDSIAVVSTLNPQLEVPMLDVIVRHPSMLEALEVVDLSESQRALVWIDSRLAAILGPGKYAFWRQPYRLEVERFDVGSLRFEHPLLEVIMTHKDASRFLQEVDVSADHDVLLFRNGVLVSALSPGKHVFWKGAGRLLVKASDRREQTADVAGQEIMTADKVTLRVNLVVTWQVTDAVKAATVVTDAAQSLYREAQLGLRAAVGARTLDQLLADKESVGGEVRSALMARSAEFGVAVRSVGLRDIILPGEMKTILNRVIEAEKQAQADLIRRREETASARSQANTARLLAENPMLARMKELELLQSVLSGTKATFVFGGGHGNGSGDLLQQVRSLIAREDEPDSARGNSGGESGG